MHENTHRGPLSLTDEELPTAATSIWGIRANCIVCARCWSLDMNTNQFTTPTLAYLDADSGVMLHRQRDLEVYLRQAGNSEKQIKFWMGFCINLEGDEDGDF